MQTNLQGDAGCPIWPKSFLWQDRSGSHHQSQSVPLAGVQVCEGAPCPPVGGMVDDCHLLYPSPFFCVLGLGPVVWLSPHFSPFLIPTETKRCSAGQAPQMFCEFCSLWCVLELLVPPCNGDVELLKSFVQFIPMLFCGWTSHVPVCYEFSRWDEEVLKGLRASNIQTLKFQKLQGSICPQPQASSVSLQYKHSSKYGKR